MRIAWSKELIAQNVKVDFGHCEIGVLNLFRISDCEIRICLFPGLDYALHCKYLTAEDHKRLTEENRAVGSMLGAMLNNPHPFLTKH